MSQLHFQHKHTDTHTFLKLLYQPHLSLKKDEKYTRTIIPDVSVTSHNTLALKGQHTSNSCPTLVKIILGSLKKGHRDTWISKETVVKSEKELSTRKASLKVSCWDSALEGWGPHSLQSV